MSSLKNLQKYEKHHFQKLRTFVLNFKVASKPFSKMLPMTNLGFKWFWRLLLTSLENDFNFLTQKLAKNWKMPFQRFGTFVFDLKVASRPFSKNISNTKFLFKQFSTFFLTLPVTSFNFFVQKFVKKTKNAVFKDSKPLFLSLR